MKGNMKTTLIMLFASLVLATQELFSRSGTPPRSPARSRSPERSSSGSRNKSPISSPIRISLASSSHRQKSAGGLLTHTSVPSGGQHSGTRPDLRYTSSGYAANVAVKLNGPGSIYTESGHKPLSNKQYNKKDMFTWAGPHGKDITFSHPEKLRVHVASAKDGSSVSAQGLRASAKAQAVKADGLGAVQSHSYKDGQHSGAVGLSRHPHEEITSEAWSNHGATALAISSGDGAEISGSASNSPLRSPSPFSGNQNPSSPRSPSRRVFSRG